MRERNEIIPTRRSLLSRLKNWDDQEAWKTFFDTYWRLIYNTAIRAGLTKSEAEDVVQETVIGVAKNIPEFEYDPARGSFKTWLLRQTTWRITAILRKRLPVHRSHVAPGTARRTTTLERVADPAMPSLEASWNAEWEENILEVAVRRVKARADAKQFQAFDFCVNRGLSPAMVANQLQMNLARVYLAKHRIAGMLKREILKLRAKPI
jgi:RNA polymerase sigma factor (sigma-70 family)